MSTFRFISSLRASALLLAVVAADGMTVTLTPSPAAPQPVGTAVTWKVAASKTGKGVIAYRFRVAGRDGVFHMARDFSQDSEFAWSPFPWEGQYKIEVTARNRSTGKTAEKVADFEASSRVKDGHAAVIGTAVPLVAIYSAPGCASGGTVRVRFAPRGSTAYSYTPATACTPTLSENFYVAGMHPKTTYVMTHEVLSDTGSTAGPPLEFETGSAPSVTPPVTVKTAAGVGTDEAYPFLVHDYLDLNPKAMAFATAVDLAGTPVWFYPSKGHGGDDPSGGGRDVSGDRRRMELIERFEAGTVIARSGLGRQRRSRNERHAAFRTACRDGQGAVRRNPS